MKRISAILLSFAVLGCSQNVPEPEVLTDSTPKLIVSGKTVIEYKPETWQTAFSSNGTVYYFGTDNMSDYCRVELEEFPEEPGQSIVAKSLEWTTKDNSISKKNVNLKAVQISENTLWLWSAKESLTLVIKTTN